MEPGRQGLKTSAGGEATAPVSFRAAVRIAIVCGLNEVRNALATSPGRSQTTLVLRAAIAQRTGDVAEAERLLSRCSQVGTAEEKLELIDLHVPLLISMGKSELAERALLEAIPEDAGARAGVAALAAVISATKLEHDVSRHAEERARELIVFCDEPFRKATVFQRLSLAAYHRNEHVEAMDLGLSAVRIAENGGFPRFAGIAYSVPYSVAHDILADPRLALYYADRTAIVARQAHDESLLIHALACQAIVSAESGNRQRLDSVRRRIVAGRYTRQFRERFGVALALALPLAWEKQFTQFHSAITAIRKGRDPAEEALCDALRAVCNVAEGDIEAARSNSRSALRLAKPRDGTACQRQQRRVARALAAVVCRRIGDDARADRAMAIQDMAGTPESTLAKAGPSAAIVHGYALVLKASTTGERVDGAIALTPTQTAFLRRLAMGLTIPEIAASDGRSLTTLRTHAREINARLGVHNRSAAIARARDLGIL